MRAQRQPWRLMVLAVAVAFVTTAACGTRVRESSASAARQAAAAGAPVAADAQDGAIDSAAAADATGAAGAAGASTAAGAGAAGSTSKTGAVAGKTGSGPASSLPPVRLGAVGTTTGIVGAQGAAFWTTLRAWIQDVNARGGIAGRKVELTIVDDGGDPARNGAAVRQLIDEQHVVAFVGSYAPISFSGGIKAIEAAGLPAIGGDSAEAGWFTSPNAFPFNGQALPQGRALSQYGCKHTSDQRLAIYYVQEIAFGQIIADQMDSGWQQCGKAVVVKQGVSLAQPDFTSEVLQAQSQNADAVAFFGDSTGCHKFVASTRRQNFKPDFFVAVSCYNPLLESDKDMITGKFYAGISTELPSADVPGMQAMRAAVAKYVPGQTNFVDGELPLGYASGKIYEAAVAAAGNSTDPAKVLAALRSMQNVTLDGMIPPRTWGPGPHKEAPCAKIAGFDGARWVPRTTEFLC